MPGSHARILLGRSEPAQMMRVTLQEEMVPTEGVEASEGLP